MWETKDWSKFLGIKNENLYIYKDIKTY